MIRFSCEAMLLPVRTSTGLTLCESRVKQRARTGTNGLVAEPKRDRAVQVTRARAREGVATDR